MQGLKTKSTFKTYPITWSLISINLFMFILETIFGGSKSTTTLCLLGANCDIYISQGEIWRLLTANFLHIGFIHLILNLAGLYIFGTITEREFSRYKYIFIYLFGGICANLFSYWSGSGFSSEPTIINCFDGGIGSISAGASGSIFSLLGAYASYLLVNKKVLGKHGNESLISIGIIVFINVVYGATAGNIDHVAHISGLIIGFLLGWMLSPVRQLIVLPESLNNESILVSVSTKLPLKYIIAVLLLLIILLKITYDQRTDYLESLINICRIN